MILLLDLETTGTDQRRHGILQIGAVWLDSEARFFRKVRPASERRDCDPGAFEVNGEHPSAVCDDSRTPEVIAIGELLGWVRSRCGDDHRVMIGGWNPHFDHRFLVDALVRAELPEKAWPFRHQLLDVHSLALMEEMRRRAAQPAADAALYGELVRGADHAAEILGVPIEPRPHGALAGALHARRMLKALGIPHVAGE